MASSGSDLSWRLIGHAGFDLKSIVVRTVILATRFELVAPG